MQKIIELRQNEIIEDGWYVVQLLSVIDQTVGTGANTERIYVVVVTNRYPVSLYTTTAGYCGVHGYYNGMTCPLCQGFNVT